jgi:hypothetical protein
MLGYHTRSWNWKGSGGIDFGWKSNIGRYLQACPLISSFQCRLPSMYIEDARRPIQLWRIPDRFLGRGTPRCVSISVNHGNHGPQKKTHGVLPR